MNSEEELYFLLICVQFKGKVTMGPCACGVHFTIYTPGFLHIKAKGILTHFDGMIENSEGMYLPYNSKEELEAIVRKILTLPNAAQIKGSILKSIQKSYHVYSLLELANRITHYEVITIIQETEFNSIFQPIYSLEKDQIFAYESLLRDPLARISPGELFEAAQKTGMQSMLDQKARQAAIKNRAGFIPSGVKSFINFLPSTIYNPEFCLRHTFEAVKRYQINPTDLVFEVVETEKIHDIDHLKNIFDVYKREGIGVALDDFGSGFATLEVLVKLAPNYVKIDRSKIDYCDQLAEKQQFLKQVVALCKELGIITLAEGIERKEELDYCKQIGITLAQGYYLGKPGNMLV